MEYIEENKKYIIILGVLVGLLIIFGIVNNITSKKQYVKTVKSVNNSKLPYININDSTVQELNTRLENQYNEIISLNNDSYMTYEFSKNGNILSILITKYIKLDDDYIPEEEYNTYNINLKNNEFLDNDDIFDLYKLDKEEIESKVVTDIMEQYQYEVDNGYVVGQECDIDCYLEEKEYISVTDNFNVYIKNKKIYGYLNIKNSSLYYSNENYPKINKIYNLNDFKIS